MSHESTVMTAQPVPVRAHGTVVRRLGHWTQARHFDVRASRASVLLDLRSPQIPVGDIEVDLDVDHAVVRLLVPEGAVIDSDEARRVGRCRVKDWMAGTARGSGGSSPRAGTAGGSGGSSAGAGTAGGRRIVLGGEMRHGEVRVYRGGIAMVMAMCSREYLADARQARREGRLPIIDDPSR
jgi:hypothetical protein